MKQFVFNEDDNIDLHTIVQELFVNTDSLDPTSIYYNRHLERPKIDWIHIFLHILAPSVTFVIIMNIFLHAGVSHMQSTIISCLFLLFYILIFLKKILICLVRIYQRFAPSSIRLKCRFEPSCSQYMILSLEKYGVYKGLKLGIKRLRRCKVGNGGFDFP